MSEFTLDDIMSTARDMIDFPLSGGSTSGSPFGSNNLGGGSGTPFSGGNRGGSPSGSGSGPRGGGSGGSDLSQFGPSSVPSGSSGRGGSPSGSGSGGFVSGGPAALSGRGGIIPQTGANGEPVYVNNLGQLSTDKNAGFDPKKSFILRPDKDSRLDRIPSNFFALPVFK